MIRWDTLTKNLDQNLECLKKSKGGKFAVECVSNDINDILYCGFATKHAALEY